MSMTIGNNMGISSGYNAGKTDGHKNVREYSNYLMGKYSCLKPGNNVAVSVTPGMLRKAMSDEKTGKWLQNMKKPHRRISAVRIFLFGLHQFDDCHFSSIAAASARRMTLV